jgi:mono/diheme cytochrome c family protein
MRRSLSMTLAFTIAACSSAPPPPVRAPAATVEAPAEPAAEPTATAAEPDAGAAAEPVAATAPTETAPTTAPTETAPTTTPSTTPSTPASRPVPAAGNAVAQGRAVFQRVCARCHEADDPDGPHPNRRWPEARMRTLVRNGNSRMRAIPASRLSDADLALLVSYLRSTHAIQ